MPRELVMVQVGQCGNQIGCRFWDMALKEHAATSKDTIYDEPLSSFFRNVDARQSREEGGGLPVGSSISKLKARAVLVDTEDGVLKQLLSGSLGEIFDGRQIISDEYGAGNNWAQGHLEYGGMYREELASKFQRTVEMCDSLQSFFLLHSLGGGTGSGLGTFILSLLADEYPDVYRFTASVFPSEDDDVVTSPYNSVLALNQLSEHADCVMPIENQALADICRKRQEKFQQGKNASPGLNAAEGRTERAKSFDEMNDIAATMLAHLTSSLRFEGSLNVDLNEVSMNLVPFPRLKFLVSSVSPVYNNPRANLGVTGTSIDAMFSDAFHRDWQLLKADPRHSTYLACALLARGDVPISDLHSNVARIKKSVNLIHWNPDGFKIGLCGTPPAGQPRALLCLANNCCIANTFGAFEQRFLRLYKRKAMLHHYDKFINASGHDTKEYMDDAAENLQVLINDYHALNSQVPPEDEPQRMTPLT